ncbi:right-handed parallel beta-helix repeat-containing protein, partial [Patescibacteria group bacterium]|nr:right-handed parallel beta-helix repeat-containing protein [Patescibacteria group bacterium]
MRRLTKTFMLTAAVLITFIVAGRLIAGEVKAATFEVNSTGDLGDSNPGNGFCDTGGLNSEAETECTLRAGLEESNTSLSSTILMNIPESDPNCLSFEDDGISDVYDPDALEVSCLAVNADPDMKWWRISPATELPFVIHDFALFADTQSGYMINTNVYPDLNNSQPVIELSCTSLDRCFSGTGSTADILLKGFAINSANISNVLSINQASGGAIELESVFIGTDISGRKLKGNTAYGVETAENGIVYIGGWLPGSGSIVVGLEASVYQHTSISGSYSRLMIQESQIGVLKNGEISYSETGVYVEGKGFLTIQKSKIAGGDTFGGIYIADTINTIFTFLIISESQIFENKYGVLLEGNPVGPGSFFEKTEITDNIISDNEMDGILHVTAGGPVEMSGNVFYNNGGLGINLVGGTEDGYGVTANDTGDTDTGPNDLMNYPEITRVVYKGGGEYYIAGDLDFPGTATIEIYESDNDESGYGEGKSYLGNVVASSPWEVILTGLEQGMTFTATATDEDGNTSEFSLNREITLWIEAEKEAEYIDRDVSGTLTQGDEIE